MACRACQLFQYENRNPVYFLLRIHCISLKFIYACCFFIGCDEPFFNNGFLLHHGRVRVNQGQKKRAPN
ncbi:hypothetical protein GV64_11695 [Endozoicomonas elysicola]|uniref:Uncharacterized protein n=1 Tax=Endozoicomonas elysicola TaxID=305900 RepID=A0A081KAY6_9GAMM|nr:hypothetical protein GV64_11695 [Endozoicomonas elysicola]